MMPKEPTKYENTTKHHNTNIAELRIIQRNLLYVSNLPLTFLNQTELLKNNQYFGQFGEIKKILTNTLKDTVNAYITFESDLSCEQAIKETDESLITSDSEINKIRVTFGTTKYCTFFLKNLRCQNMECMYLHKQGDLYDVLTKDIMKYYTSNQPKDEGMNKKNIVFHTFKGVNRNMLFLGKYNFQKINPGGNKTLFIKELINTEFENRTRVARINSFNPR